MSHDNCCDFGKSRVVSSRREFLKQTGAGFGTLGLAGLLESQGLLAHAANPLSPKTGNYPGKAKSCIFLFMYGGPSGFDTFDYKPALKKYNGKKLDWMGDLDTFNPNPGPLMDSPYEFKQYGECGQWVSEVYPAMAQCVDDMAFINSCWCESNNHAPAMFQMNTGISRVGYPSIGSWMNYGLGTENDSLPGYVVMYDHRGGPIGGPQNWGSGFLPSTYQATPFRASGTPILNLENDRGLNLKDQRAQLDLLKALNEEHAEQHPAESDLVARIESYELAFRMQMEAPEAVDISGESEETKRLYGLDNEVTKYYGTQLLIARRLVERGVRFIQCYSGGGHQQESWDAHFGLKENHDMHCAETDVPMAGLIMDLKRRGLLDDTLVVWGGEFGRMPTSQGAVGRDHNPDGFLMWMAGGGIKGGVRYGETDEVGYKAAENPVHVNDIHATILDRMGLQHEKLTYKHNGRDFRLTDVGGKVIKDIIA